jgi:hypothetical protein
MDPDHTKILRKQALFNWKKFSKEQPSEWLTGKRHTKTAQSTASITQSISSQLTANCCGNYPF